MAPDTEPSMRRRILDAVHVVLSRSGHEKLQLSEVAAEAGVSRPTLYRYFGSREGLLEAFSLYEQDNFDAGIAAAMAGLSGEDRLDAALQFIVEFQNSFSARAVVDIEPGHVLAEMRRLLPAMHSRLRHVIPGDRADIAAAAVVRIAVCHYLVQGGSPDQFLAELRHAAGLEPRRRRLPRAAAG
ncbi:TetR/AcrR family transcriptional regulator [Mycolicibacterium septicum]|uniref:TetR/AcrR family transcriptional regulator n=1 Tax=Mycolicibacterium septicum TaxID=98668 RepID=A0ABW9M181_9MYCO